jgi:hypothetical protein
MMVFLNFRLAFRLVSAWVILSFIFTSVLPGQALAQSIALPTPGSMVGPSASLVPVTLKGLKVHPENPLLFDFIIDSGTSGVRVESPAFKEESQKLIKYFLASLTIREDDLWVNLSPYEKDRMTTDELGKTTLGQDMLAQDYILKQLTASLIYPEKDLGKAFWSRVYAQAQEKFGAAASDIPVDTFNKVWITADKAKVLEKNGAAYILDGHLKVMIESDYLAESMEHGAESEEHRAGSIEQKENSNNSNNPSMLSAPSSMLAQQVLKDIIIPEIEKEVNEGANFAPLRQMFHSMILATWYKTALKSALLNQVYSDKGKTSGVLSDDPASNEKVYSRYLEAYRKGVFNYIKEETSPGGESVPRKYFSGGLAPNLNITLDRAQSASPAELAPVGAMAQLTLQVAGTRSDAAMAAPELSDVILKRSFRYASEEMTVEEWIFSLNLIARAVNSYGFLRWRDTTAVIDNDSANRPRFLGVSKLARFLEGRIPKLLIGTYKITGSDTYVLSFGLTLKLLRRRATYFQKRDEVLSELRTVAAAIAGALPETKGHFTVPGPGENITADAAMSPQEKDWWDGFKGRALRSADGRVVEVMAANLAAEGSKEAWADVIRETLRINPQDTVLVVEDQNTNGRRQPYPHRVVLVTAAGRVYEVKPVLGSRIEGLYKTKPQGALTSHPYFLGGNEPQRSAVRQWVSDQVVRLVMGSVRSQLDGRRFSQRLTPDVLEAMGFEGVGLNIKYESWDEPRLVTAALGQATAVFLVAGQEVSIVQPAEAVRRVEGSVNLRLHRISYQGRPEGALNILYIDAAMENTAEVVEGLGAGSDAAMPPQGEMSQGQGLSFSNFGRNSTLTLTAGGVTYVIGRDGKSFVMDGQPLFRGGEEQRTWGGLTLYKKGQGALRVANRSEGSVPYSVTVGVSVDQAMTAGEDRAMRVVVLDIGHNPSAKDSLARSLRGKGYTVVDGIDALQAGEVPLVVASDRPLKDIRPKMNGRHDLHYLLLGAVDARQVASQLNTTPERVLGVDPSGLEASGVIPFLEQGLRESPESIRKTVETLIKTARLVITQFSDQPLPEEGGRDSALSLKTVLDVLARSIAKDEPSPSFDQMLRALQETADQRKADIETLSRRELSPLSSYADGARPQLAILLIQIFAQTAEFLSLLADAAMVPPEGFGVLPESVAAFVATLSGDPLITHPLDEAETRQMMELAFDSMTAGEMKGAFASLGEYGSVPALGALKERFSRMPPAIGIIREHVLEQRDYPRRELALEAIRQLEQRLSVPVNQRLDAAWVLEAEVQKLYQALRGRLTEGETYINAVWQRPQEQDQLFTLGASKLNGVEADNRINRENVRQAPISLFPDQVGLTMTVQGVRRAVIFNQEGFRAFMQRLSAVNIDLARKILASADPAMKTSFSVTEKESIRMDLLLLLAGGRRAATTFQDYAKTDIYRRLVSLAEIVRAADDLSAWMRISRDLSRDAQLVEKEVRALGRNPLRPMFKRRSAGGAQDRLRKVFEEISSNVSLMVRMMSGQDLDADAAMTGRSIPSFAELQRLNASLSDPENLIDGKMAQRVQGLAQLRHEWTPEQLRARSMLLVGIIGDRRYGPWTRSTALEYFTFEGYGQPEAENGSMNTDWQAVQRAIEYAWGSSNRYIKAGAAEAAVRLRPYVKQSDLDSRILTGLLAKIAQHPEAKALLDGGGDAAMKAPGGIDLNSKNMDLDVAKDGRGVEINLDPAMVAEFQKGNFTGVEGIILRIVPIQSPLAILNMG